MEGLLHKLFGPSRKEIWRQFAKQIDAKYWENGSWGFDRSKVIAQHNEWIITLDNLDEAGEGDNIYTRIRAPYINKDGFRFTIYRESFFSPLSRYFGMQDVEIVHQPFDDDFVIKGNDEYKLWKLFKNDRIRELISRQPQIHLSITSPVDQTWYNKPFKSNTDELRFKIHGIIKDMDQLKSLFELFAELLDHLCHIGAAYENDPRIKD